MEKCPQCGNGYKSLAHHCNYSPSHRPNLTEKQLEITIGLLMGDGNIHRQNKTCHLRTTMTNNNYLRYLDNVFGFLSNGVKSGRTAGKSAKNNINSGSNPHADSKNYSNLYRWNSVPHPKFNEFREWYSSGEKVWPEDIELTPTVLKHWYVGDGNYDNHNTNNCMRIAMSNEVENTEKVSKYFTNVGLPKPSNYSIYERDDGGKNCSAKWSVEDSYTLWGYMGEPLPDFEYKWPEEYR